MCDFVEVVYTNTPTTFIQCANNTALKISICPRR